MAIHHCYLQMMMVWHFVSASHKVMTALFLVLPSRCRVVELSLQFHRYAPSLIQMLVSFLRSRRSTSYFCNWLIIDTWQPCQTIWLYAIALGLESGQLLALEWRGGFCFFSSFQHSKELCGHGPCSQFRWRQEERKSDQCYVPLLLNGHNQQLIWIPPDRMICECSD